jgi:hypothetical protein
MGGFYPSRSSLDVGEKWFYTGLIPLNKRR